MKLATLGAAAALVAVPALAIASGGGGRVKSGPAIIPYLCDGGRAAIVYESGDFHHGRATVTFDGRRLELGAAPTLYGLRYRGEEDGSSAVAWTLRGEEGWLTESPSEESYMNEEQALARCVRLRGESPATMHVDDH